jgi:hypothetical protein
MPRSHDCSHAGGAKCVAGRAGWPGRGSALEQQAARVDPSDVIQEVLAEASQKLEGYLRDRPLPFYPWLRQLAWEQLATLQRRHVRAQKRSVRREEADGGRCHRPGLAHE